METTNLQFCQETLRWSSVPLGIMIATTVGFVYSFFGTGRKWLALTGTGFNLAAQIVSILIPTSGIRYATAIHQVEGLGGAKFTVPTIVNGPANVLAMISLILLSIFSLDASIKLWKKGGQQRTVLIGGSFIFFIFLARGHAILIEQGIVQMPFFVSITYLPVLVAMGHELSVEVLSAATLARQLRESESRMKLAAETARLGMWIWDATRDEIWMTDTGRAVFGFEPEKKINYAAFIGRVHPDDRMMRDSAIKQAMSTHQNYGIEFRVLLPDGRMRWVASRGGLMNPEKGRANKIVGVAMDITMQKEAELSASQQREEIAHLGRISMMGQLSAALAHELNEPLGAILRNVEAAEIYLESESLDREEMRGLLADIRADDERAGEVIDRLSGLLKRRDIVLTSISVEDLFNRVLAIVRVDAAARQVRVEVSIVPGIPRAQADLVHIQQVLLNLILNAMDAMRDTPTDRRLITLNARQNKEGRIEIEVGDKGPGIASDKLAKVFHPFFTTKKDGMGMGLAISRTIIEAHRGELEAENKVGSGALFRFTLHSQAY